MEARRAELAADYRTLFASPCKAAELGCIAEVVRPEHTRDRIAQSLRMLRNKRQDNPRRKHGNIPL